MKVSIAEFEISGGCPTELYAVDSSVETYPEIVCSLPIICYPEINAYLSSL